MRDYRLTVNTTLTDAADGDHVLTAGGGTLTDRVYYPGLAVNKSYALRGELIDKATGIATGLTSTMSLTPTTGSGYVDVTFTVPQGYAGKTLVAFQYLYDSNGYMVLAEHTDINSILKRVTVSQ